MTAAKKIEISPALQSAIADAVSVAVAKALREQAPALAAADRVMRLPEVMKTTALSRSSLYAMIKQGTFCAGFALGPNSTGWLASDVLRWVAERAASRKEA